MSNVVHIVRTSFHDYLQGFLEDPTYGYRIYDDQGNRTYSNLYEEGDIPVNDLAFFHWLIQQGDEEVDIVVDYILGHETIGVDIDGTYYEHDVLKRIIDSLDTNEELDYGQLVEEHGS